MDFFQKKRHFEGLPKRIKKMWEIFLKCSILLAIPLPYSFGATTFWYFIIFRRGMHFNERMEVIVTAAWIPIFGILYSLLVAVIVATVWGEYKSIRTAIKRYDIDTFVDLRDEEMSPLIYTLMGALSMFVLASFMSLKYPDWMSGTTIIASTAYVLCLLFIVVKEIDDPCAGIWFIKNIPPEWLEIDVKEWRKKRHSQTKAEQARQEKLLEIPNGHTHDLARKE